MTVPNNQASDLTPDQDLKKAIAYHQAGNLLDAERIYMAILNSDPKHTDANHNLGVLAVQRSQAAEGLQFFKAALEANPLFAQYWFSYVDALIKAGQHGLARIVMAQARQRGLTGEAADALDVRLAAPSSLYLNLGAGSIKLPGFINIDLDPQADMQLDLTKKLPWPDRSVGGIYCEHFIEHLNQTEVIQLLHECRRILMPGGIIRVATPDLVQVVQQYVDNFKDPVWDRHGYYWANSRCERFNLAMRDWGHKWMFDEEELVRLAIMVGFTVRARCDLGQSLDNVFRNLETRDSSSLIIEFEKPDRTAAASSNPLVSIVIPGYNPACFVKAVESALSQTYGNIEIVIRDDCRADEVKKIASGNSMHDSRIRYEQNPEPLGRGNFIKCFDDAQGEFILFLNDDEELEPSSVERMLDAFAKYPDISLVTSCLNRVEEEGRLSATIHPVDMDAIIEGVSLGSALLSTGVNFLGELTTAMFRKRDLTGIKPDFISIDGRQITALKDILILIHLAMKGDVIYLSEPLGRVGTRSVQNRSALRDELIKIVPEELAVIRYAWSRFGFASNQSVPLLRFRPLTDSNSAWQERTIKAGEIG